tara:strand:- start:132 stop:491 length:360 start_codon:yes stop_codon:yes gene_type:complete
MRNILKNSVQTFLLIAMVFFIIMLIMMTGCVMDSNRKPEAPKNLAPTLDSVIAMDSVMIIDDPNGIIPPQLDMDSIQDEHINEKIEEYHGKEGKSEYGQYEPSDEYRMWITGDGDTIWE